MVLVIKEGITVVFGLVADILKPATIKHIYRFAVNVIEESDEKVEGHKPGVSIRPRIVISMCYSDESPFPMDFFYFCVPISVAEGVGIILGVPRVQTNVLPPFSSLA